LVKKQKMAATDVSHLSLVASQLVTDRENYKSRGDSMLSSGKSMGDLYDRIYEHIGSFGRYQKLLSLVVLWGTMGMGLHSSVTIYVQPEMQTINCTAQETNISDLTENTVYLNATQEFKLFCENDWKRSFLTTVFFIGFGLGAMCVGYMCDNLGRKTTLMISVYLE